MAWKVRVQKRQRRGSKDVGARLVFSDGKRSEEKIWVRDPDQSAPKFRAMIVTERDAWLRHYNRGTSVEVLTEVDL